MSGNTSQYKNLIWRHNLRALKSDFQNLWKTLKKHFENLWKTLKISENGSLVRFSSDESLWKTLKTVSENLWESLRNSEMKKNVYLAWWIQADWHVCPCAVPANLLSLFQSYWASGSCGTSWGRSTQAWRRPKQGDIFLELIVWRSSSASVHILSNVHNILPV